MTQDALHGLRLDLRLVEWKCQGVRLNAFSITGRAEAGVSDKDAPYRSDYVIVNFTCRHELQFAIMDVA